MVPDYSAAMVTAVAVSSLFSCYCAAVAEILSANHSYGRLTVDSAVSRHLSITLSAYFKLQLHTYR